MKSDLFHNEESKSIPLRKRGRPCKAAASSGDKNFCSSENLNGGTCSDGNESELAFLCFEYETQMNDGENKCYFLNMRQFIPHNQFLFETRPFNFMPKAGSPLDFMYKLLSFKNLNESSLRFVGFLFQRKLERKKTTNIFHTEEHLDFF